MFSRFFISAAAFVFLNSSAGAQGTEAERQARIIPLFKNARAAEAAHDLNGAIANYDRILAIDPALAEVWANRGLVLHELSRHKEALRSFEKAVTFKPELLNAQLFLGLECLRLGAPEKAIKPLELVTARDPHQVQALFELSEAYAQTRQFEAAVETNGRLFRAGPRGYPAMYQLGVIYLKWSKAIAAEMLNSPVAGAYGKLLKGDMEEIAGLTSAAETHYTDAVREKPDDVVPRLALARFYLKKPSPESIQKAKAELQLAIAKDALDPAVTAQFARLAIIEKQTPTALDSIRCISVSDPLFGKRVVLELAEEFPEFSPNLESNAHLLEPAKRDALCHLTSYTESAAHLTAAASARLLTAAESLSLAQSKWQLGEYTAALNALEKPAQDPANSAARYWMFLTTRALARQTLQAAVVQDPDSYRAHLVLADMAKDSGDTAKAETEYARAAEMGASDPEVQLIYIQFLESIKKDSRAVDGARAAVAKFPTNPKLNLELGQLLLKAGEPKTAASCFQRSLAADPDLIAARVGLADSYAATGFPDRAITEIKPALNTDRDGSLYYRIARWYQQTGHMAEASQAFATTKKLKNQAFKRDVEKLHGDP